MSSLGSGSSGRGEQRQPGNEGEYQTMRGCLSLTLMSIIVTVIGIAILLMFGRFGG